MRVARLLVGTFVLASVALACQVTTIELGGASDDAGLAALDASIVRDASTLDGGADAALDAAADSAVACAPTTLTGAGGACTPDLALFESSGNACATGTAPLSRFVPDESCDAGTSRSAMYTCCAVDEKGCGGGSLSGAEGFCSTLTQLFASAIQGCALSHGALAAFTTFGCDADAGMAQGASYTCCP